MGLPRLRRGVLRGRLRPVARAVRDHRHPRRAREVRALLRSAPALLRPRRRPRPLRRPCRRSGVRASGARVRPEDAVVADGARRAHAHEPRRHAGGRPRLPSRPPRARAGSGRGRRERPRGDPARRRGRGRDRSGPPLRRFDAARVRARRPCATSPPIRSRRPRPTSASRRSPTPRSSSPPARSTRWRSRPRLRRTAALVEGALAAGLHVYCEKPLDADGRRRPRARPPRPRGRPGRAGRPPVPVPALGPGRARPDRGRRDR